MSSQCLPKPLNSSFGKLSNDRLIGKNPMRRRQVDEMSRTPSRVTTPVVRHKHRHEYEQVEYMHVRDWARSLGRGVLGAFELILVFFVAFGVELLNLSIKGTMFGDYITLPRETEQKAAVSVNQAFSSLPKSVFFWRMNIDVIPAANIALIVALLFLVITRGTTPVAGILASIPLFDESLYCLVSQNPSTACLIDCALISFIFADVMKNSVPASLVWVISCLLSWCFGVLSVLVRVEFGVALALVLLFAFTESLMSVRRADIGFFSFMFKLFVSLILAGVCWGMTTVASRKFGIPGVECIPVDPKALLAEVVVHPHSIKSYGIFTGIVFVLFLLFEVPVGTTVPYLVGACASLFFPATSVIDELLVRWIVFKVLIIIFGGRILTTCSTPISVGVTAAVMALLVYEFHCEK